MKPLELLKTELEEGILIITLDNPGQQNALSTACIDALREVIQEVYDNNDIKSAIITGTGDEVFATGAPLEEIKALNELNGRKFAENGQETFALIENCHKPILAAVNGRAHDGGFELALACHLRVASENAVLGFPEVAMGLIPGFGGTQRLTHLIGKTRASELLMTGAEITAAAAKDIGLIGHVVSYPDAMLKKGKEILRRIMANSPLAVGMLVNCTNAASNPNENGYQMEANSFAHCCTAEGFREGVDTLTNE
ncbi:MAG: enoyl-CoA hydratase-related protein [Bacteroidota bacterium]